MKAALLTKLHYLAFTILLVGWLPSYAQEGNSCRSERKLLAELQSDLQHYHELSEQIESLANGGNDADISLQQLQTLLSGETSGVTEWPETVRCAQLQDAYRTNRNSLVWEQQHLSELRKAYWLEQDKTVREAIGSIWRSRERLRQDQQQLLAALNPTQIAQLSAPLDQLQQSLLSQRAQFFQALPELSKPPSANTLSVWIQQWRQSLKLLGDLPRADEKLLAGLPANVQSMLNEHYHIARLDALVIANTYNQLRSWLWKRWPSEFARAQARVKLDKTQLLRYEALAIINMLQWLYTDTQVYFTAHSGSGLVARFFQGIEYLFGLLSFILLVIIARRMKTTTANWQQNLARNHRKSRVYSQFMRIGFGVSELIPWVVGWFGLVLLKQLFIDYHLVLLVPLIPLGKLYVLYGVLRLCAVWLLLRINERAAAFLNPQQSALIQSGAKRAASLVMLPWLLQALVTLAIGYSLLHDLLFGLTVFSAFIALGLMLKPWRQELILALQSFLPANIDPWVERWLASPLFLLLAPLTLPVLLVALLIIFVHRTLVDFDWYRKIMARSFMLRSAAPAQAETAVSDEGALEKYQHWFGDKLEREQLPFIKIELSASIQQFLTPWLNHQSEENTLLISGERGSGKSTVLWKMQDWLLEQDGDISIEYLSVPAKTTSATAVKSLLGSTLSLDLEDGPAALVKADESLKPTVMVIEEAQNFFLREVNGLGGWETLLSFTKARLSNVFWIIAINNQSWAYLRYVFGGDYQFSNVLTTRPWSQGDIRSLILSRNQLSGFTLRYDDILLASRGPEAGSVRNAEQLYFSLLWDSCRGNPMLALQMWLSSITVRSKTVTVGLPEEVSAATLERLGEELHFVYAALVLHENMTSEELVTTTAIAPGTVRAALKTAFDAGFVERNADRRYRLVPLWYPAIEKLLARKNLLYE